MEFGCCQGVGIMFIPDRHNPVLVDSNFNLPLKSLLKHERQLSGAHVQLPLIVYTGCRTGHGTTNFISQPIWDYTHISTTF